MIDALIDFKILIIIPRLSSQFQYCHHGSTSAITGPRLRSWNQDLYLGSTVVIMNHDCNHGSKIRILMSRSAIMGPRLFATLITKHLVLRVHCFAWCRALGSCNDRSMAKEEKAKKRDLSMFLKFHFIKCMIPTGPGKPFPPWTTFAGPDDDLDDEDFYTDEVPLKEDEGAQEADKAGQEADNAGKEADNGGKEADKKRGNKRKGAEGAEKGSGKGKGEAPNQDEGAQVEDDAAQAAEEEEKEEDDDVDMGMEDAWYDRRTYMLALLQSFTVEKYGDVQFGPCFGS